MYSEQLIDHFTNPRHIGVITKPDGIGIIGDPDCGDFIKIYITVKADYIYDISFEVCGCPASIATTSVLTEIAYGKTLSQAYSINEMDVLKALGSLPEAKIHCSNLGIAALRLAIDHFRHRISS
jgi:nitrogen fixation protein NifU and related proteins